MTKLALVLAATVMLLSPVAASAHRAVIVGGPPVIYAPAPCGGFHPGYYPGYASPPGVFFGTGPDLRVYDPDRYYRWYYGQYFTPRPERVQGYTFPGRR